MRRQLVKASRQHKPVLVEEVLSHLSLKAGDCVLDGTVGSGGHAEAILRAIAPTGQLLGLDQDTSALERTRKRLKPIGGNFSLEHANFRDLDRILENLNLNSLHAVLIDIGVSTEQLDAAERGFSFIKDGPLDMRMNPEGGGPDAATLVRSLREAELVELFYRLGEERHSRRIAREIVARRKDAPIQTTLALRELIEGLAPGRGRYMKIHPATRVFQALRIAVNRELEALEEVLPKAVAALRPGGKVAVITFHSLEDRIVKWFFRKQKELGTGQILTKKPIRPTRAEVVANAAARSAKLRVFERAETR
jgi:16S rRNA (cytosine1402-N4)-methyltransferase